MDMLSVISCLWESDRFSSNIWEFAIKSWERPNLPNFSPVANACANANATIHNTQYNTLYTARRIWTNPLETQID